MCNFLICEKTHKQESYHAIHYRRHLGACVSMLLYCGGPLSVMDELVRVLLRVVAVPYQAEGDNTFLYYLAEARGRVALYSRLVLGENNDVSMGIARTRYAYALTECLEHVDTMLLLDPGAMVIVARLPHNSSNHRSFHLIFDCPAAGRRRTSARTLLADHQRQTSDVAREFDPIPESELDQWTPKFFTFVASDVCVVQEVLALESLAAQFVVHIVLPKTGEARVKVADEVKAVLQLAVRQCCQGICQNSSSDMFGSIGVGREVYPYSFTGFTCAAKIREGSREHRRIDKFMQKVETKIDSLV